MSAPRSEQRLGEVMASIDAVLLPYFDTDRIRKLSDVALASPTPLLDALRNMLLAATVAGRHSPAHAAGAADVLHAYVDTLYAHLGAARRPDPDWVKRR